MQATKPTATQNSPAGNGRIINFDRPEEARTQNDARPPILTSEALSDAILTAGSLDAAQIVPRENVCGTWFKQGDLGFVFGERGQGKTWFALDLATGLADGRKVGPWPVSKPRNVLYIDGEMPLDGMRDRTLSFDCRSDRLAVLNHEWLFQKSGCILNLSDLITQRTILKRCVEGNIEVVIVDNLSCTVSGVAENDADAWERVLAWLLELRRHRIAVVIVHHANRAGQHMRGTSRREDAAFWVIRLDGKPEHSRSGEGAQFITRFTKARQGDRDEQEPIDWQYKPDGSRTTVTFRPLQTIEVFKQWIRDGLNSCSDIAEEMGVTRGTVSKLAKKGKDAGWLKVDGRTYELVEAA